MKSNQVNILAFTVLCNLKQIDQTQEALFARQSWSDVWKTNWLDGIHLYLAFFHWVAGTCRYMGASPESNTAGDVSATNPLAKALGEQHDDAYLDSNLISALT